MASDKVRDITDAQFDKDIVQGAKPTLVDFWAVWCAPCRAIAPAVEQLAETYGDRVQFAKMNIDENPQIPTRYEIRSIPTLLLFKGGQVIGQIVGAVPKTRIEEMVKKAL